MSKKLKVFSLGGLDEIGKNIAVLEYGDDIIAIDCGVAFPDDDMPGVDLVIPDFAYLIANKKKVRGLVLTHGHEDHIGATPYFLREINAPVYGTKLTLGLLSNKLKEHEHTLQAPPRLEVKRFGEIFSLGAFKIELLAVTHSIADSAAVAVHTPLGTVIHSGDFKIDHTPISKQKMDLQRFAQIGSDGVLLFMCESTNIEQKGFTMSERSVGAILDDIFDQTPNSRIMVATFSSNIDRIQQILNSAQKHNRKALFIGRSMINAASTAIELGYLSAPPKLIIEPHELINYDDGEIVIITTGSQGEPMSVLSRMAQSEHKQIEVKAGDKIIISAAPIPGNEKTVNRVIDSLMQKGAEVIYYGLMEAHVSGHAKQEEIKLLHALIKPKYFMPIHGAHRHLNHHKNIAVSLGMKEENIFVIQNGEVLEISDSGARITESVQSGYLLVDGSIVGDVGSVVLNDRRRLAKDGLVIVVASICHDAGRIITLSGPDIVSRGFVYVKESEELMREAKDFAAEILYICSERGVTDWGLLRNAIRDNMRDFFWRQTKRNPMILPIIMQM